MNKPDGGEFAGQTRFITEDNTVWTSEGVVQRIHFEFVSDFKALILMTDGISDPIFETDSNFENVERWNDLWNTLTKDVKMAKENTDIETELLLWLDFWSDGNHDDRTIAILF